MNEYAILTAYVGEHCVERLAHSPTIRLLALQDMNSCWIDANVR